VVASCERERGGRIKRSIIIIPVPDTAESRDPRLLLLTRWIGQFPQFDAGSIEVASADASFRRYFRLRRHDGESWIAMDAPPDREDLATYLRVASLLEGCGVHVPHVLASDIGQGFALIEDLGATPLLAELRRSASGAAHYADALDMLAQLQLHGDAASRSLPPYDHARLVHEMLLLPDWYCRHLNLTLTADETQLIAATFDWIATRAVEQPLVFVHRDYHSRNLMVTRERSPGVIDFQDALRGPVGYDLASILKDCYIHWPRAQVVQWVKEYRARLLAGGDAGRALAGESDAQFLHWFDLIGLQRHIKVLGIFARLFWRDGKTGYLADLPRTLQYAQEAARLFPELAAFADFLDTRLAPGRPAANARALEHAARQQAT
jgi:aminoglycoside/choline kinase family phosphotransferase